MNGGGVSRMRHLAHDRRARAPGRHRRRGRRWTSAGTYVASRNATFPKAIRSSTSSVAAATLWPFTNVPLLEPEVAQRDLLVVDDQLGVPPGDRRVEPPRGHTSARARRSGARQLEVERLGAVGADEAVEHRGGIWRELGRGRSKQVRGTVRGVVGRRVPSRPFAVHLHRSRPDHLSPRHRLPDPPDGGQHRPRLVLRLRPLRRRDGVEHDSRAGLHVRHAAGDDARADRDRQVHARAAVAM